MNVQDPLGNLLRGLPDTSHAALVGKLAALARTKGVELPTREKIDEIARAASLLTSMILLKVPDGIVGIPDIARQTWKEFFWEMIEEDIRRRLQP